MQSGYTRIDEDTISYEENGQVHFAKLCDAGKEKRLSDEQKRALAKLRFWYRIEIYITRLINPAKYMVLPIVLLACRMSFKETKQMMQEINRENFQFIDEYYKDQIAKLYNSFDFEV